jgi:hypothetical protein
LQKNPKLLVKRESAREIRSVNDLVENGFLIISEEYLKWVDAEEEKRLVGATEGEADLFEAKAKVQALKYHRLQQHARGLTGRLAEERAKTRPLKEKNRNLADKHRICANRLRTIQSSRSWRLLNKLARLQARVLGR